ncbi:MAG: Fic family protein [Oscillospiraceae bacterium]|nr:Fic family protein [Oscillospiraceae bacterium]
MDLYEMTVQRWRSDGAERETEPYKYSDSFDILFAYHSGKTEDHKIAYRDTREIFQSGKVAGYTGDVRALVEQQNLKLCAKLIKRKLIAKEPITIDLIKEIHLASASGTYDQKLFAEQGERPGEFRKNDRLPGMHSPGADGIEALMLKLTVDMNECAGENALRAGACFYARFENIRPFADMNGITGRILLNYYLISRNHPPLIVFEEDKKRYFTALEACKKSESTDLLYDFFAEQTVKTWEKSFGHETE